MPGHADATALPGAILIVDDDPASLHLLEQVLRAAGYVVATAASAEQALWAALKNPPDLIVLDVDLPGMSGIEACRCLKQHPRTVSVPVVFLSAASDPGEKVIGFDAGAVDYIGKPCIEAEVLSRVKTHIGTGLVARKLLRRRQQNARAAQAPLRPEEVQILVVEDTPAAMQLLVSILGDAGYGVREAPNGELALWSATNRPPDLILLDVRMPGMNGFDVCRCLKADPATAHVPVIFISALASVEDVSEGLAVGAVDYIGKPFDAQEVLARVRAHLRSAARPQSPHDVPPHSPDPLATLDEATLAHEFASLLAASPSATLLVTAAGRIDYVSPAFVRLTGHDLGDLATLPLEAWLTEATPPPFATALAAVGPDAVGDWHGTLRTAAGAALNCRMAISWLDGTPPRHLIATLRNEVEPPMAPHDAERRQAQSEAALIAAQGLEPDLRQALANNEMELWYQAVVDLGSGRLVTAEALLRWRAGGAEPLPPANFLTLAEDTGEIIPIGAWATRHACATARGWQDALPGGITLAINISSLQFWQDRFVDDIARLVGDSGLPPARLRIDIAVGTMLEDVFQGIAVLRHLKAIGVMLGLDQYGEVALAWEALPPGLFDVLTISRHLTARLGEDAAALHTIQSIADMAHDLGMVVVANGIEQKWQLEMAKACRCDQAQGYLIGTPLAAADFHARHIAPLMLWNRHDA